MSVIKQTKRWSLLCCLIVATQCLGQSGSGSATGTVTGGGSNGIIQLSQLSGVAIVLDPPANTTIGIGGKANFEVAGIFTDPNLSADLTSLCVFVSSDVTKVSVAATGSDPRPATGVATGSSDISCSYSGFTSNTITISVVALTINPLTIPTGTAQNFYTTTFTASGGTPPYTYTCNPACTNITGIGLTLSSAGVLSGTLTVGSDSGSPYAFTVRATDSLAVVGSVNYSLKVNPAVVPGVLVTLPNVFVNNHECDSSFTYELALPSTWITSAAPGWPAHLPYALTRDGLQSVVNDMEAYRTSHAVGIKVDIPPGLYSGNGTFGLVIPQSSNALASSANCLILASTQDSSLPNGRVVCAHGIQDNNAGATDIGIENPDCTSPNDQQFMWTLECSALGCVPLTNCSPVASGNNPPQCVGTTVGPDHWLIMDAEVRMSAGLKNGNNLYQLRPSGIETSVSQLSSHFHTRKVWVHGDWTSLTVGANSVANGFLMNCIYCSITDSQMSRALFPGGEGHAIGTTYGQQLKIVHNWFEGQTIGLLCGGTANGKGPSVAGLVACVDMEVRRNRWTYPIAYMNQHFLPSTNLNFKCNPNCPTLARKSSYENKSSIRSIFVGNINENVPNGGQGGVNAVWNIWNDSGLNHGTNYQDVISDTYIANNIFRTSCSGPNFSARSLSISSGVAQPMERVWMLNNLFYNISGNLLGCAGAGNNGLRMFDAANKWKGNITRVSGVATMTMTCTPDITNNCPAGPPGIGSQVTSTRIGDPISITGCTGDTTFNVPLHNVGGVPAPINLGPLAIAGTLPNGLTVVWASPGADSTDNTGTCVFNNVEAWPKNFYFTHNTFITDASQTIAFAQSTTGGPNFAVNNIYRNNILTVSTAVNGGAFYDGGEGTVAEIFVEDTPSLTFDYMVIPNRAASKYTEYSNNPFFPDGPCVPLAGCSPPGTIFFPATSYCTGATSNATCVGFVGAMSMTSLPINLANYNNYALRSDSVFSSSGANKASDGTDMGANITTINSAQTQTIFTCPFTCLGTPFSD